MAKVPFRVSARAARLIGRENVASSQGAVTELVKNAYDADADVCAVLFVPRWSVLPERFTRQEISALRRLFPSIDDVVEEIDGRWQVKDGADPSDRDKLTETLDQILDLWIIDNGHGMSADIINERWMVIGTNAKELNGLSNGGRVVTGAKGIGRFALDRLGGESDLYSGQDGADSIVHWFVDWTDFEGAGKVVSDVEALLETEKQPLAEIYTTEGLTDLLPKRRPAPGRTGIVEHAGDDNELGAPAAQGPATNEPADSEEEPGEPIIWDTGTAIRIGLLADIWDATDSLRLKETLASLLPPMERADFNIYVYDYRADAGNGFIDNIPPDQFDYRMVATVKADAKVRIRLERQEIDSARIRPSVFDADAMKQPGFTKEDFSRGFHEFDTDLRQLLKLEEDDDVTPYHDVGPFEFTLYFFKLQNPTSINLKHYPQKNFDVSRRRAWLKNSGGIRLYRDNFRVRPYGEPGSQAYDWLLLGERVARNPAAASRVGWTVPPQQLAGTLSITKEDNPGLDDQSNREGIRNERVFAAFRDIVRALIGTFEHDRSYILNQFKAAFERDMPPSPTVAEAMRIVKQYRRDPSSDGGATPAPAEARVAPEQVSSDIELLGETLESKVHELEAAKDDNQVLRGMATLGTILVSFTHELKQIKADMEARGDRLSTAVQAVTDPERLALLPEPARPASILRRMRRQDEKVSRWVDFALAAVSPAKRRRRVIEVQTYLDGLKTYWDEFLVARKIHLDVDGTVAGGLDILAHEIDLDSIFYNLINNSVEALLKPSGDMQREIVIRATAAGAGWIDFEYRDNGPGLAATFNVAEDIFLFGVSSKKDDGLGEAGTGIGMWLLRNVVDDYGGSVRLLSALGQPGFNLVVRLPAHRAIQGA